MHDVIYVNTTTNEISFDKKDGFIPYIEGTVVSNNADKLKASVDSLRDYLTHSIIACTIMYSGDRMIKKTSVYCIICVTLLAINMSLNLPEWAVFSIIGIQAACVVLSIKAIREHINKIQVLSDKSNEKDIEKLIKDKFNY